MRNIKECLDANSNQIQVLNESYIARVVATETVEYIVPVDFKIRQIKVPMTSGDVNFIYEEHSETQTRNIGNYRFDTYYPIGTELTFMNKKAKVLGYGTVEKNIHGNNLYYVDMYIETLDAIETNVRVNNDIIEGEVINALNGLVAANAHIASQMRYYTYNPLMLIGSEESDVLSSQKFIEAINATSELLLRNLSYRISADGAMNDDNAITEDQETLIDYTGSPWITIRHGACDHRVSAMSFVYWYYKDFVNTDEDLTKKLSYRTMKLMSNFTNNFSIISIADDYSEDVPRILINIENPNLDYDVLIKIAKNETYFDDFGMAPEFVSMKINKETTETEDYLPEGIRSPWVKLATIFSDIAESI